MSRFFCLFFLFSIFFSCTNESEEAYFGCTDPNASNFNPSAIEDDNSCLYYIGCTNPDACNYNFLAIEDDVEGLIEEVMGKFSGVSGGIGGSQHLFSENFISCIALFTF